MIIKLFQSIQLVQSQALNIVLQAVLLEVALFLCVPVLGIVIEAVIVKFFRRIIARLITARGEYFFSSYLLFPGVMIHELSHAFFALITGARITEIALFKPDGDSLGHVSFVARGDTFFRALQNSFSACAPVVTGMVLTSLIAFKLFPVLAGPLQWVLAIYIFIAVLFHMNMSSADLKCYFRGALPLLVFALPICLAVLIFAK